MDVLRILHDADDFVRRVIDQQQRGDRARGQTYRASVSWTIATRGVSGRSRSSNSRPATRPTPKASK